MSQITAGNTTISLVRGDITEQDTDVVVNAANTSLLGGGGVDGAIHKAGGPQILEECRQIRAAQGGCKTGEAVMTTAGQMKASKVVHTVGPVWAGGSKGEYILLERAYDNSLNLVRKAKLKTVAFPSISTGAYRFPTEQAALVALGTMVRFARKHEGALDEIRLVLFSDTDLSVYRKALDEVQQTMMG